VAAGLGYMSACAGAEDRLGKLLSAEAVPKGSTFAPVGFHGKASSSSLSSDLSELVSMLKT
jgi:hypothetical protein